MSHVPVLLSETIAALVTNPHGVYIDGTFGRGGHSQALLEKLAEDGHLLAIDQDLQAIDYAKKNLSDKRFTIIHASFADLLEIAEKHNLLGKVDGILLDVGVSSPQLDLAERGFSFMQDGPLDMRMNQQQTLTAAEWINQANEKDMAAIFKNYGEERFAKRIAAAICRQRQQHKIKSTLQLAEIIKQANPKWEKHKHPATRVFQAIRIFINDELQSLQKALEDSLQILKSGGRLAVISFHSLEDRMVKQFFRRAEQGKVIPKGLPVLEIDLEKKVKKVSKAVKPSDTEVAENPRARSAILRVVEKL